MAWARRVFNLRRSKSPQHYFHIYKLRVVPHSISLLCVTRGKPREKMAARYLGHKKLLSRTFRPQDYSVSRSPDWTQEGLLLVFVSYWVLNNFFTQHWRGGLARMRTKKLRAIYLIMDNFKRYQRRKFVSQLCAAYRWEFLLKTLSETRFKKITESNGNTTHLSQSCAHLVFSFSYSRNCKHLSDFGKSTIPPTPSLSCQEFSTYSKTIFERWDQIFWSRDLEKNLESFFFFFSNTH